MNFSKQQTRAENIMIQSFLFKFKENLNVKKKKNLSITNIYLDRCAIFLHISSVTQTLSSQETKISLAQIRYVTFCIL